MESKEKHGVVWWPRRAVVKEVNYTTGNYLPFNLMAYSVSCLIHGRLFPFLCVLCFLDELICIRATHVPPLLESFMAWVSGTSLSLPLHSPSSLLQVSLSFFLSLQGYHWPGLIVISQLGLSKTK